MHAQESMRSTVAMSTCTLGKVLGKVTGHERRKAESGCVQAPRECSSVHMQAHART